MLIMSPLPRSGKGALARSGKYWYPVRLITSAFFGDEPMPRWRVQWWRSCEFDVVPDKDRWLPQGELTDELWCDRECQRKTRVR